MPHIVLEYAEPLGDKIDVPGLLTTLHHTLAEQGSFALPAIKSRAYPVAVYEVGDRGPGALFLHVTVNVLGGRQEHQVVVAGQVLHACLQQAVAHVPDVTVTQEFREMNPVFYFK